MNPTAYSNLLKLIILIIIFVVIVHLSTRTIPYSLINLQTSPNEIYDLGHEIVDRIYRIPEKQCDSKRIYESVSNIVIALFIVFGLIPLGIDMVLRSLTVLVIVQILKRVFCLSTILPNPKRNKCWPEKKHHMPLLGVCNELFFSGHFIEYTLIGFLIWNYLWSPVYFGAFSAFITFALYWNLSCQYHYTIDILTSVPVTLLVAMMMFKN